METPPTYTLADVIQQINDEQIWWAEATHNADPAEVEEPGLAGVWSFKDVVNHLTIWQRRNVEELRAARDGTDRPAPEWPAEIEAIKDEDTRVTYINAWTAERDKDIPAEEAIAQFTMLLGEFEIFVSEMSDESINDPELFPTLDGLSLADAVMSGEFMDHLHGEHDPEMQKWMASRTVESPTI